MGKNKNGKTETPSGVTKEGGFRNSEVGIVILAMGILGAVLFAGSEIAERYYLRESEYRDKRCSRILNTINKEELESSLNSALIGMCAELTVKPSGVLEPVLQTPVAESCSFSVDGLSGCEARASIQIGVSKKTFRKGLLLWFDYPNSTGNQINSNAPKWGDKKYTREGLIPKRGKAFPQGDKKWVRVKKPSAKQGKVLPKKIRRAANY